MKTLIAILIIAALLQASVLDLNLVLILLICRSFITVDSLNYYLAFFSGLFLGILSATNIGFWPVIFLVVVKLVSTSKSLPISRNLLTIIPVSAVILSATAVIESVVFQQSPSWWKVLAEIVITLPIYIVLRFLEERVASKTDFRLKL